jgi:hypothetical protein
VATTHGVSAAGAVAPILSYFDTILFPFGASSVFAPGEIYRAMYFLWLGCFLLMRFAKSDPVTGYHNR